VAESYCVRVYYAINYCRAQNCQRTSLLSLSIPAARIPVFVAYPVKDNLAVIGQLLVVVLLASVHPELKFDSLAPESIAKRENSPIAFHLVFHMTRTAQDNRRTDGLAPDLKGSDNQQQNADH